MCKTTDAPQVPCFSCATSDDPMQLCPQHLTELPGDYRTIDHTQRRLDAFRVADGIRQRNAMQQFYAQIRAVR